MSADMKTKYIYMGVEIQRPQEGHYWYVLETRTIGTGENTKTMTMNYYFESLRSAKQFIRHYYGNYNA